MSPHRMWLWRTLKRRSEVAFEMMPGSADLNKLAEALHALAYPSRLEILKLLREPRALADIRLAPRQLQPGGSGERAVARQTLQTHLDKLLDVGIVVAREPESAGRHTREFVVNQQRLYQIMEDLRSVGAVSPLVDAPRDATVGLEAARAPAPAVGPNLALVHGLHEGKAFALSRAKLQGERGWVIGRKPGLQVSLEYDPYVSIENAEVIPEAGRLVLIDLRSSKNGTLHNWRRIDRDERVALEPGDVIGVGRSLLVFRSK